MNVFELISSVNRLAVLNERCHKAIMRNREPDVDDDDESNRLAEAVLKQVPEDHREGIKYELLTKIKNNDLELLKFGFVWVKYFLWGTRSKVIRQR